MLCCASWFTDHTAALGSSLLCFPVSLHRVFLVESWDRRGWCGFPDFGVLGFFCFSLFFLSFCFVFIVVRTQSSDSWELGSVYNLFYLCNQCIYSCISLQILYIFLQNWFFREGNPGCFILDTCSCLQCGYKRLETMNSQFEGIAFLVSVYSAPIVEGVVLQSSIVYLLIFYFGTLKSFSKEKQINIFIWYWCSFPFTYRTSDLT